MTEEGPHQDGRGQVGPADVHQDVVVLVEVDAHLVLGEDGVLVFWQAGGDVGHFGSWRGSEETLQLQN